jgi:hypothetical protein
LRIPFSTKTVLLAKEQEFQEGTILAASTLRKRIKTLPLLNLHSLF